MRSLSSVASLSTVFGPGPSSLPTRRLSSTLFSSIRFVGFGQTNPRVIAAPQTCVGLQIPLAGRIYEAILQGFVYGCLQKHWRTCLLLLDENSLGCFIICGKAGDTSRKPAEVQTCAGLPGVPCVTHSFAICPLFAPRTCREVCCCGSTPSGVSSCGETLVLICSK